VKRILTILVIAMAVTAHADSRRTFAAFGDWPYSTDLYNAAPQLIASINGDKDVSLVIHVGDIHSGSMPCIGAGLTPLPTGSDPQWNTKIYNLFAQFEDPFVYTPGDNEWTDCHKKKEFLSGAPMNELAAVRALFFAHPGFTLGLHPKRVLSQANLVNAANSGDAKFVENVLWTDAQIVYVTLNVPGSNNDGIAWTAPFTDETARTAEVAQRNAANLRWLDAAFGIARLTRAKGIVIAIQADMWDPAALDTGGDGLNGYDELVRRLAERTAAFGKPVLLLNGDSHVYEADHPLADPNSAMGKIHGATAAPNLTRITVQGSTNAKEWLKVTIDPSTKDVFTWQRIQYLP